MRFHRRFAFMMIFAALAATSASAQKKTASGQNAALRYWAAFAQMQDSAITDEGTKQLNGILDGPVPYDDSKYKELVGKNRPALEMMARGTLLPNCDWGTDYKLGADAPVDYAREALALGRLNVLYAFHLAVAGNKDNAARTIAAGLHFSRDVGADGTLFATLAAKSLIVTHLRAVEFLLHTGELSGSQRSLLAQSIESLGPGALYWQSAMRRELGLLRKSDGNAGSLAQITAAYDAALADPSKLTSLQQKIAAAPPSLRDLVPNPKRVLEEKRDLTDKLSQTRALLR